MTEENTGMTEKEDIMAKSVKRREKDRLRRERELLVRVMAESVIAELLPEAMFSDDDRYFREIEDYLIDPTKGHMAIKFKPQSLAWLVGNDFTPDTEVNPVVVLEKRRGRKEYGGNWYFFATVLYRGAVDRQWSEVLSDRLGDHDSMRRAGKRLRVWDVRQVWEGFANLFRHRF